MRCLGPRDAHSAPARPRSARSAPPRPAHPAVVLHVLQLALLADAKVQEVLPLHLQGLLVGLGAAVWSPQAAPDLVRPPTHPLGWPCPLPPLARPGLPSLPGELPDRELPRQRGVSGPRTWMGPTAGCPSSTMRSPSSSSWFTHCSWLSSSCCLKCWERIEAEALAVRTRPALCPPPPPPPPPLTSYSLRRPAGSARWSLQSCCRMRCCCWARAFSWRVQPCRCVYRLPRLCPRHEAAFCARMRGERHHQAAPRKAGLVKGAGSPPSPPWGSPGGPGIGSGWWLRPVSTKGEKTQAQ